ncbi:MAG: arabinofuranosidase catalytic domain-containing protein [Terracidiphilus sp.]
MPRLQRFLVLGALGPLLLLCAQSCVLNGWPGATLLPCATQASGQIAVSPCDIYGAAQTACVAAFSTARALYGSYAGPLYQVTRKSDMTTLSIGVLSDGYANAAAQDEFCANTTCTITKIFDQSPRHNDLAVAPPGEVVRGTGPGGQDLPAFANSLPITAGGHKVYGVYLSPGMGYRNDAASGVAVNGQPEGVYMVSSGIHVDGGCCFDFGNAERNNRNNGAGHMDALRLLCGNPCNPNVGLDMENGTYPYPPFPVPAGIQFVTAMGANDGQHSYAVYWGDAQAGCLVTSGSLSLPTKEYSPMHQEGAIILGIGGDNSNFSGGSFFEGAMTAGAPSNAAMIAVQANVVSVGYAAVANP